MADGGTTATAIDLIERLPKDVLDPEARERLKRFTERIGAAMRTDEEGRTVADRRALVELAGDGEFFPPSVSKALLRALEGADTDELVDERGLVRPLSRADLAKLPGDLTAENIDGFLAGLESRLEGLSKLEIIPLEDIPQAAEGEEPIPQEDVPEKLEAFKECLKENFGYFVLMLVLAGIGVILAIVGVFVPPVEPAALWITAVFGSVVAGYIIHCLTIAGFFREN